MKKPARYFIPDQNFAPDFFNRSISDTTVIKLYDDILASMHRILEEKDANAIGSLQEPIGIFKEKLALMSVESGLSHGYSRCLNGISDRIIDQTPKYKQYVDWDKFSETIAALEAMDKERRKKHIVREHWANNPIRSKQV